MRKLCFLSLFLLTGLLQSCLQDDAAVYPTYKNYTVQNANQNTILLHAYSYQQTTGYTCGPSVVMTLMHYYGLMSNADMNKAAELRIAKEMGTSGNGTNQENMVAWLKQHDFDVTYGQNVTIDMLVDNLKKGIPTIVVWNDWDGHSMLVVGYQVKGNSEDDDNDVMFLADPSTTSSIVENKEFQPGINTITPSELKLNWFNAKYFFNPSHTAIGMYIIAVPRKKA